MDFEKFPSLTRFSQGWTISEKLDGTNAQIVIAPVNENVSSNALCIWYDENGDQVQLLAGSRNRWLTLNKDNMGFARWAGSHAHELKALGIGRHFGEWYGSGIQRTYGLTGGDKRFALFNSLRWANNPDLPSCCEVVHTFVHDEYLYNPQAEAEEIMNQMREYGSFHVQGFDKPEGIVLFHRKSGVAFKKTFDYDEQGKWAEQVNARKERT